MKFEGIFEDGFLTGHGTKTWKDGKQFKGFFIKFYEHGIGTLTEAGKEQVVLFNKGKLVIRSNDPSGI